MGDFDGHRTIDAEITSNAADGFTLDINGTQVMFKQGAVPVLVEIYVENEENPIGAINIANGETVLLGGQDEGLRNYVESSLDNIQESIEDLERLRQRINPTGTDGTYLPEGNGMCPVCGEPYDIVEELEADRMDEAWDQVEQDADPCVSSPKGDDSGRVYYHDASWP